MPVTFYDYKIASGYNNAAGLTNVELLTAGGRYFYAVAIGGHDLNLKTQENGVGFASGFSLLIWKSNVTRAHYAYIRDTLLGGKYSAPVTIRSRLDDTVYANYNAVLTIPRTRNVKRNYDLYEQMEWEFTRLVAL